MSLNDKKLKNESLFQTGLEIRILICGGKEMAVPDASISAVKELKGKQAGKYLQQGGVCLKEFGGFWSGLAQHFTGSLAGYGNSLLRNMTLPVIVPRGIGLSELPDNTAEYLVILSAGDWHGALLSSFIHEQPIMLGTFTPSRNGDVAGRIERTNVDDILLIDVVSLLKREGFLTVTG